MKRECFNTLFAILSRKTSTCKHWIQYFIRVLSIGKVSNFMIKYCFQYTFRKGGLYCCTNGNKCSCSSDKSLVTFASLQNNTQILSFNF